MFEGDALLRRMVRYGMLGEEEKKLDYVLQLTTSKMLERRLQTIVFKGQVNGILQTKFAVVSRCVSGIQICAPKPDLVRHCVPRPAVGAAAWRVDTDATPKLI